MWAKPNLDRRTRSLVTIGIVQRLSDRAVQRGTNLKELAASDAQVRGALAADTLRRVFDVSAYLGSTDELIGRALGGFRTIRAETTN